MSLLHPWECKAPSLMCHCSIFLQKRLGSLHLHQMTCHKLFRGSSARRRSSSWLPSVGGVGGCEATVTHAVTQKKEKKWNDESCNLIISHASSASPLSGGKQPPRQAWRARRSRGTDRVPRLPANKPAWSSSEWSLIISACSRSMTQYAAGGSLPDPRSFLAKQTRHQPPPYRCHQKHQEL